MDRSILTAASISGDIGGIEGTVPAQRGIAGSIGTKATPRHDGGGDVRISLGEPEDKT